MTMEKTRLLRMGWMATSMVALATALGGLVLTGCDSTDSGPEGDPNAEIVITSPRGGETFHVGDTLRVKWKAQGKGLTEVDAVNIEVSPDSGKTWLTVLTRSIGTRDANWGNYPWAIPATLERLAIVYTLTGNAKCMIKIMQYSTGDPNKIASTKAFTISGPK